MGNDNTDPIISVSELKIIRLPVIVISVNLGLLVVDMSCGNVSTTVPV